MDPKVESLIEKANKTFRTAFTAAATTAERDTLSKAYREYQAALHAVSLANITNITKLDPGMSISITAEQAEPLVMAFIRSCGNDMVQISLKKASEKLYFSYQTAIQRVKDQEQLSAITELYGDTLNAFGTIGYNSSINEADFEQLKFQFKQTALLIKAKPSPVSEAKIPAEQSGPMVSWANACRALNSAYNDVIREIDDQEQIVKITAIYAQTLNDMSYFCQDMQISGSQFEQAKAGFKDATEQVKGQSLKIN